MKRNQQPKLYILQINKLYYPEIDGIEHTKCVFMRLTPGVNL